MTDSVTWIFLATDCTATDFDRQGPEEDHMELLHLPLADAMAMVVSGAIADAKTVVGLLLTERQLAASG
jgi:ADP-ribose pyrophosphatase